MHIKFPPDCVCGEFLRTPWELCAETLRSVCLTVGFGYGTDKTYTLSVFPKHLVSEKGEVKLCIRREFLIHAILYIFVRPIITVCSFRDENVDRLRLAVSFECGTDETYPTAYVDTPSGAVCSLRAENVDRLRLAVSFECGTDETYPTAYVDTPSGAVCSFCAENVRQKTSL